MSGEQRRYIVRACSKCGLEDHRQNHPPYCTECYSEWTIEPLTVVPESAVADAVRAERERMAGALREHTVNRADEDGCLVPMNPFTSWREAADFIERLPQDHE